jgi:hypothetical protein
MSRQIISLIDDPSSGGNPVYPKPLISLIVGRGLEPDQIAAIISADGEEPCTIVAEGDNDFGITGYHHDTHFARLERLNFATSRLLPWPSLGADGESDRELLGQIRHSNDPEAFRAFVEAAARQ